MRNDEHWKVTDCGDSVMYEYIGPPWVPTPEEQARMNAFCQEFWRTHRPAAILCRPLPLDPARPDEIRLVPERVVPQPREKPDPTEFT